MAQILAHKTAIATGYSVAQMAAHLRQQAQVKNCQNRRNCQALPIEKQGPSLFLIQGLHPPFFRSLMLKGIGPFNFGNLCQFRRFWQCF
jgi:hypothetical protein